MPPAQLVGVTYLGFFAEILPLLKRRKHIRFYCLFTIGNNPKEAVMSISRRETFTLLLTALIMPLGSVGCPCPLQHVEVTPSVTMAAGVKIGTADVTTKFDMGCCPNGYSAEGQSQYKAIVGLLETLTKEVCSGEIDPDKFKEKQADCISSLNALGDIECKQAPSSKVVANNLVFLNKMNLTLSGVRPKATTHKELWDEIKAIGVIDK
jgi:hypothetical protein